MCSTHGACLRSSFLVQESLISFSVVIFLCVLVSLRLKVRILLVSVQLGVERVVVGRELSIRDLNSFSHPSNDSVDTHTGKLPDIEAFVHGALCVSYSGQCFSSEAWGGRSANRGQCAQACRLDYGMLVDGSLKSMGDVQYLLR